MSFFAGSGSKKVKPDYTGIQLQTSSSVQALTIQLGTNRVGPNLLWYADFKAHKVKQKAGKGGGGQSTSYTYSASCILGLCEGDPNLTVGQVFVDSSTPVSYQSLGMSLFKGTNPQDTWGYLTSKHPTQARDYAGVAYMAVANYDLGSSASLPNHSFEVFGIGNKTASDGSNDADPALCIDRFLTASAYGVGMRRSVIDLTTLYSVNGQTTGDAAYQTYCGAKGWGLSPTISDQTSASDTLALWAQVTNTAIVWTGYSLKFIPYDLSAVTGHGYIYVPNTTPAYTLSDDDFVSSKDDPVKFERTDPADAYNQLTVNLNDRTNQYNSAPADWRDQGLIDQYGLIPGSSIDADCITSMAMGTEVTRLVGQRMAYVNNTGTFVLGQAHILLEPMDLLVVEDPLLGDILVQIDTVEEDDDYNLTITADQISIAVSSNDSATIPISVISNVVNQAASPGPVNPVILFDVPSNLSGGVAQVWAAISGGDGTTANMYWGGANVYVSTDNITYNLIGVSDNPARQGKTTNDLPAFTDANPEAATFNVNLGESEGELTSVSAADAATYTTISKVGDEFIAYQTATLTALNEYDLSTIYRGLYQSTPIDHPAGTAFTRLDDAIFKYDLPADLIGIPLFFKFQSFNIWGNTPEDLSDCVAYTYTPTGLGFKIAPPTNLGLSFVSRTQGDGTSIIRGTVTLTPSAGPYLDHQDVQITSDNGATWSDIPAIPQGSTTTYFEPALGATNYQARSRAVSSAVGGIPSDWVTTAVINSGALGGTKPAVPTGLTATGLTLSNGLSWTPGAGAGGTPQGFYIYAQHVGTGGVFANATRVGHADIDLFNHTGLGSDDAWTYWVTAYNAAGESDPVGPEVATTETTGGGGGGASLSVLEEGVVVLNPTAKMNFKGSGVTVAVDSTDATQVNVEIDDGSIPNTPPTMVQVASVIAGGSPVCNLPAAPKDGNLLVAVGTHWHNAHNTQNGYISIYDSNGATNGGLMIAYKVAAGDGAAQSPWNTSEGVTATVFEVSGQTGAPTVIGTVQESGSNPVGVGGTTNNYSLCVGQFMVGFNGDPITLTGNTTEALTDITGDSGRENPMHVVSFAFTPTGSAGAVAAHLTGSYDSYAMLVNIPGTKGVPAGVTVTDGTTSVPSVKKFLFTGATVTSGPDAQEVSVAITGGGGGGSGGGSGELGAVKIATVSVTAAGVHTINLMSNIPQSYKDLFIEGYAGTDSTNNADSASLLLTLNGDTSTSYEFMLESGFPSTTAYFNGQAGVTAAYSAPLNSVGAGLTPSYFKTTIPRYNTVDGAKALISEFVCHQSNTNIYAGKVYSRWASSTPGPISRIDLGLTEGVAFAVGSVIELWGVPLSSGGTRAAPPAIVQKVFNRFNTSGSLTLPAAPTPGNTLLLMSTGAGGSPAVIPTGFTPIGYNANGNVVPQPGNGQQFQHSWAAAKFVASGDPATLNISTGDWTNLALYELSGEVSFDYVCSQLATSGGAFQVSPTMPRMGGGLRFVFLEQDAANDLILDPIVGLSTEHLFTDSGSNNHRAALGLVTNDFEGVVTGTSSGFTYPQFTLISAASISPTPGLGKPWYWNPPKAASYTPVGDELPILADDSVAGMLVDLNEAQTNDCCRGAVKPVATGDFDYRIRCEVTSIDVNYGGAGILLLDQAGGKAYQIRSERDGSGSLNVARVNYPTGYSSTAYSTAMARSPSWLRVKRVTGVLTFMVSYDGRSWLTLFNEAETAWLPNGVTSIGPGGFYNRSNTADHRILISVQYAGDGKDLPA